MDDPEIDDLFFFYSTKKVTDPSKFNILNISFTEVTYETTEFDGFDDDPNMK